MVKSGIQHVWVNILNGFEAGALVIARKLTIHTSIHTSGQDSCGYTTDLGRTTHRVTLHEMTNQHYLGGVSDVL